MKLYMKNKKIMIILIILTVIFMVIGGTLAYFNWQTSESQKTNVVFTATSTFSCSADGGGSITSSDLVMLPTTCTDSEHAIKREITVNPTLKINDLSITMNLWLNINSLGTGLSDSENFRYALTTSSTSCETGVVSLGTFNGKTAGNGIKLLTSNYSATTTETYYLYIWLDKDETSVTTAGQSFDFSLNGECAETPLFVESYSCSNSSQGEEPYNFTYTGDCEVIDDGDNNWRVKFLTSGTLTSSVIAYIDVFLVGGGGGGYGGGVPSTSSSSTVFGGGGGGGGYTSTISSIIKNGAVYSISIGNGGSYGYSGSVTRAFGGIANGGSPGSGRLGGNGGSGGAGGAMTYCLPTGYPGGKACSGATDGNDGGCVNGGKGQGTTTREFGESTGTLYASGGSSGIAIARCSNSSNDIGCDQNITIANSGNGGCGYRGTGSSGIVVIRNSR